MAENPHLYLAATMDLERALAWLAEVNAQREAPRRLLMAGLFLKAVACSLREVPELNGFWLDGRNQPSTAVHLGARDGEIPTPGNRPLLPLRYHLARCLENNSACWYAIS